MGKSIELLQLCFDLRVFVPFYIILPGTRVLTSLSRDLNGGQK